MRAAASSDVKHGAHCAPKRASVKGPSFGRLDGGVRRRVWSTHDTTRYRPFGPNSAGLSHSPPPRLVWRYPARVTRSASLAFMPQLALLSACAPAIMITRFEPAQVDLAWPQTIVLVESTDVTRFVAGDFGDLLLTGLRERGVRTVKDARGAGYAFDRLVESPSSDVSRAFLRRFPGDLYVRAAVSRAGALRRVDEIVTRGGEWGEPKTFLLWAEGYCDATVDLFDAREGNMAAHLEVQGLADSPKHSWWDNMWRYTTTMEAKQQAALRAVRRFLPRRVTTAVALERRAPSFADGLAKVKAGQLSEARVIWEAALKTNPDSAALHYNIAVVCEALGDNVAAVSHLKRALALAPSKANYLRALARVQEDLPARGGGATPGLSRPSFP